MVAPVVGAGGRRAAAATTATATTRATSGVLQMLAPPEAAHRLRLSLHPRPDEATAPATKAIEGDDGTTIPAKAKERDPVRQPVQPRRRGAAGSSAWPSAPSWRRCSAGVGRGRSWRVSFSINVFRSYAWMNISYFVSLVHIFCSLVLLTITFPTQQTTKPSNTQNPTATRSWDCALPTTSGIPSWRCWR